MEHPMESSFVSFFALLMLLEIARDAFFIIFIVKFIFKSMEGEVKKDCSNNSDEYIFEGGKGRLLCMLRVRTGEKITSESFKASLRLKESPR